jgi:ABC-type molybdate transport system substrate-binding protein
MAKATNLMVGGLLAIWLGFAANAARADEIKVLCDNALAVPLDHVLSSFHMVTGDMVSLTADTAAGVRQRLEKGEAADAVIVAKDVLDELEQSHLTVPGARIDLATAAAAREDGNAGAAAGTARMYTGGLVMHTQVAPAATGFIRYLASKAGREAFLAAGLTPAPLSAVNKKSRDVPSKSNN